VVVRAVREAGAWWMERHSPPVTAFPGRCLSKDVEDPPEQVFSDRNFQGMPHVRQDRAPGQAVRGRQRDAAHHFGTHVAYHLNDDYTVLASAQLTVEGRSAGESGIHDTSTNGKHRPAVRFLTCSLSIDPATILCTE